MAKINPSSRSNAPPCPGSIFPVSLICAFLFKYDIIKSPTELLTKEDKDALVQEIYNEELEEVKKGEY